MLSTSLYSQDTITSKIDSAMGCIGDTLNIAVHVTNFINVDGISTDIDLNPAVLTYLSVQNVHPSLMNGSLIIFQAGSSLKTSWFIPVGTATIPDGILYELVFIYHGGSCCLHGNGGYGGITIDTTLWIDGCVSFEIPIDLGNDTTICYHDTLTLNAGNPGFYYLWSTGETTNSIICTTTTNDTTISYHVAVTDSNGCVVSDTIIVTFDPCLSIKDIINIPLINIFPNPSIKKVFISQINGVIIKEANIYNQFGQKVLHEKSITNSIDISGLKKGLYIIELISDKFIKREKLIIE